MGNPLRGDDGVGCLVVAELKRQDLPFGVDVVDIGCGGFNVLELLTDVNKVVLVDAVEMGTPAGTLHRLNGEALLEQLATQGCFSHENSLGPILHLVAEVATLPEIVFFGVQAGHFRLNEALSPAVLQRLPELVRSIQEEIMNC